MTLTERFWSKVQFTDTCWLWTGATRGSRGYGDFALDTKHNVRAHRWAYEFCTGPIPADLEPDHLCRVRHCVNPDHLEAVTHRENTLRGIGWAGTHARKTHCIHGHSFDEENTIRVPNGRECRECRRTMNRANYWKRRQRLEELSRKR